MSTEFLEEAIVYPKESISLEITKKNIMSVNVPVMKFKRKMEEDEGSIYPYGYANTSGNWIQLLKSYMVFCLNYWN